MNDKLDPRLPLCVRCGCPEGEPAEYVPAKLDAREVCQHCAYERKERAAIKRAITREINRSDAAENGDQAAAYRSGLRWAKDWIEARGERERRR